MGLWFAISPFVFIAYLTLTQDVSVMPLLGRALPDAAMMGGVLVLGEAIRSRRALQQERDRSERLLPNVLPAPIAARLKDDGDVIAGAYPQATVTFADLVDFTVRTQRIGPSGSARIWRAKRAPDETWRAAAGTQPWCTK